MKIYNEFFFTEKCNFVKDGKAIKSDLSNQCNKLIEIFKPKKILDCGCATGLYEYGFSLVDRNIEITGFDISEYALDHCIEEVKSALFLLDLEYQKIPYQDNYFDLILCCDFLEHIHPEYMDFAIGEIARVCSGSIFCRQPFCKFQLAGKKLHEEFLKYNLMTNSERLSLIDNNPMFYACEQSTGCPYHPSERGRQYFIDKFMQHGLYEVFIDENYYKYPNDLGITSWTSLIMRKPEESI